jgi:YbbR domain-containing protein
MNIVQRIARGVVFIARGAVSSIAGNVSLAALALALALSLWLYVTDAENPTETQVFNSAVPLDFVNVPNDLAVANASATTVRIRIEAPKNELDGLQVDDFEASVNLGGFERGTQNVAVDVTTPNRRIDIVEVTPSRIDVALEDLRTKEVPVRVSLVGSPQQGFEATDQQVEPDRVTVSGAESLVELVDSAVAEVSLTAQRVDLNDERVRLQPRDQRGGQIARVSVNPETARVDVTIEQTEFSLEFAVTPSITGQPAGGFNVGGVTADPRVVVVTGPLEVLQSIDALRGITTGEISIADARDDVIRAVPLNVPEGVTVRDVDSVRVNVDIVPARGEYSFRVVPDVINVGGGLVATPAGPVTITLTGDVPVLETIAPETIVAVVNAAGLQAGLYALPVEVTAPPGTAIVRIEPLELGVSLSPQ